MAAAATEWTLIDQSTIDAVGADLPYRISKPGNYRLAGDITVQRHKEFARMTVPEIRARFAVIAIEADNVTLDLNRKSLSMTELMADRVLEGASLIELGNTPYPTGVFPETFAAEHVPANHVVIRNGLLSSTGHFAVHGVGNSDVVLEDLVINRVGVGGITLSAFRSNLNIQRCRVVSTALPLRASLEDLGRIELERSQGVKVSNIELGTSTIPDGSLFTGIHVNGQFTVKQQPVDRPDEHGAGIRIVDCEISNIIGRTEDYGALLDDEGEVMTTSTGVILQPTKICPHLSALSKDQLAELGVEPPTSIAPHRRRMGLDIRGHHLKGVHGIRLVALNDVVLRGNRIANIENWAEPQGDMCVTGTAAGVAIRACGTVKLEDNVIENVLFPNDPTRAGDVLRE